MHAADTTGGRRAVLLFARAATTEARAKGLSRARRLFELGRDRALRAARALDGVTLVVAGDLGSARLPDGAIQLRQRGSSFGARLRNAFDDTGELGFSTVVAVGIDSPTLCEAHLARTFGALESAATVLGPAADGGVWAIGVRGPCAELFEGVRWRTRFACADLLRNAPSAVQLGTVLLDLDHHADLRALRRRVVDRELGAVLEALFAVARRAHLPRHERAPAQRWTVSRETPRGPPAPALVG